jgi:hypothetical protein
MGLFDKLGQGAAPAPAQGQPGQITPDMVRAEVGNIRQNPAAYLGRYGMKIPEGINMNDPREITTYLLRSGQIGGGRVQQIFQMLGMKPGR